jgi:hypothetical protein
MLQLRTITQGTPNKRTLASKAMRASGNNIWNAFRSATREQIFNGGDYFASPYYNRNKASTTSPFREAGLDTPTKYTKTEGIIKS